MSSKGRSWDQRIMFSKYKREVFKKAAELSTLCGADIAILLFSPQRNTTTVYSFGSPSLDSIINRFLGENRRELRELEKQLKAEKERGKALEVARQKWEDYINGLGWEELQQLKGKLEGLKRNVQAELQKKDAAASASASDSSMSDANYGPPAEENEEDHA